MTISQDSRILIDHKVVILLSDTLDSIQDIGCFIFQKGNFQNPFQFFSLIDRLGRRTIQDTLKRDLKPILTFNGQVKPVFYESGGSQRLLTIYNDENTEESMLLKISLDEMKCYLVYKSKARVQNLDVFIDSLGHSGGFKATKAPSPSPLPSSQ